MPTSANGVGVVLNPNPSKKSVFVAYLLWLFGGIFGMHHYYLGRDRHGFVWWTTLGGFGVGWLGEVLKVRKYVLDANEDHKYMTELISKMQRNPKMTMYAIPPDAVWGINLRYLNLLIPLAAALGREKGSLKWPLIGAYAAYPIRYYIFDESLWVMAVVITSALLFDSFAKNWDRQPSKRHFVKRVAVIGVCTCLYLSLWGSYLWLDLKQCLIETYNYAQHHGWYEVWKQIIDLSDPHGEQNAYKQEITSIWRRLSRENHPDKVKDETLRRQAQDRFMEIQQAYELLSNSKNRRNRRNKKDNSADL
ncbi:DnaJ-18 [Operophtera brumata]|uniref:DnaJ homolog subfamily C member 22 n=1 Tax=Operophtera brumata TaxID=104452 RepID=A0A0L7LPT9_OPEBR|nr:DnaJ-18 [Operophtera brumata]